MASEQQFRAYFLVRRREWAPRVPREVRRPEWGEPQLANYYVQVAGNSTLVADLRNDGRFVEHEICAFVQNRTDDEVINILADILGEFGAPLEPVGAKVLLAAIKGACTDGMSPWLIAVLAVVGVALVSVGTAKVIDDFTRKS